MKQLVVLVSNVGKGSNLEAVITATKSGAVKMSIIGVVCDVKDAPALIHAKKNKISVKICTNKNELLPLLIKLKPDYIALAGWKQIILDKVIDLYPNRIINLHPGLVPDAGKANVLAPDKTKALWNRGLLADKAIKNFLDKKATYAGSSVHFLTHKFDFGPVLARGFEKIKKNDTIDTLYARLKTKEHKIYIQALQNLSGLKVLIIDAGGRGSVLGQKYLESKKVSRVYAIPGNDFMKYQQNVSTYPNLKTTDIKEIIKIAKEENIDLVDVAQDDAVAAGLVDALQKEKVSVFGPTKKAGQIEWDKTWSRNFMKKFKHPIPKYLSFKSEQNGIKFINGQPDNPWFIKAAGLAAGKGAIFAKNNKEAINAIAQMKYFGIAGKTYLIEECLEGEEFSAFALISGINFKILGYAQDHKRAFDGDLGPNTGGMGCSSPPKVVTKKIEYQVNKIFKKTTHGLVELNIAYVGVLYLGCIVDNKGKVRIIEFNARWGDPEAQAILPSIKNDYFDLISKTIAGNTPNIKSEQKYRVVVAAVSKGYPGNYSKVTGKTISNFEKLNFKNVYGAGVKKDKNKWVAAGGRLFYVTGDGVNVAQARKKAYNALSQVSVTDSGMHFRTDIGSRDLNRYTNGRNKAKHLSDRR